MKNISKKTKIIAFLTAALIIAGIIVIFTIGLNFELKYQSAKYTQLYLGKEFEISDIEKITNEVFQDQEVMIQKVEVFEETVGITTKDITDEQKSNLVTKINEKYETELDAANIEVTNIPHTRGRDIIKPYVIPFIVATIIILIYMGIRFYKLGILKTILKTVLFLVITQAVLLSVIAIIRIPIGKLTIPLVLVVYVLTLGIITINFEKHLGQAQDYTEV